MLIPFLAAFGLLVAALALFPAFVPARRPTDRGAYDRAVYRRQLGELERELQYGLIHAEQAVSARTEIGRRLLAADKISPGPSVRARPRDVILAGALVALVPAGAMLLYTVLGSPAVPDQPYSARAAERAASAGRHVDLDSAVASLKAKLQQSPDNPEDWLLLARTQASLKNWEESSEAFRRALALTGDRPDVAAAYGEMLVRQSDGLVTPHALKMFKVAEARDPRNISARYYLGLAAAQSGTPNAAIAAWTNLLAEAPPDAPYVVDLRRSITDTAKAAGLPVPPLEAGRQPSGDVADAGSSAQAVIDRDQAAGTDAMIRGMVERLASELDAKPNNVQGWLQLAQSYTVLHDRTKAVTAFERAAMLKPNDPAILVRELNALMSGKPPEAPVAPRVVSLLHRIEALDPSQPEALWYLGLAEAQAHHPAGAARYWRRLADELPASSAVRRTVLKALATVEGTQQEN